MRILILLSLLSLAACAPQYGPRAYAPASQPDWNGLTQTGLMLMQPQRRPIVTCRSAYSGVPMMGTTTTCY